MSWSAVLIWGGLRGALSMVLALGLVADFPHRDLLITMTYGVVILSLLVQGLTMPWLLRWFGVVAARSGRLTADLARGHVSVSEGAIAEIDRLARTHTVGRRVLEALRERYERRFAEWRERLEELDRGTELAEEEVHRTVRHLLHNEKAHLAARLHDGLLLPDAYDQLLADVDERIDRLDRADYDDVRDLLGGAQPPTESADGQEHDDTLGLDR
jgi:CPA1 family monovalent cation:H+ antiporter